MAWVNTSKPRIAVADYFTTERATLEYHTEWRGELIKSAAWKMATSPVSVWIH